jgi:hypothetical protein
MSVEQTEKLEDQVLRISAINELANVSKEVVRAVLEVVGSDVTPELKHKCLTVLHITSTNVAAFERLSNSTKEKDVESLSLGVTGIRDSFGNGSKREKTLVS